MSTIETLNCENCDTHTECRYDPGSGEMICELCYSHRDNSSDLEEEEVRICRGTVWDLVMSSLNYHQNVKKTLTNNRGEIFDWDYIDDFDTNESAAAEIVELIKSRMTSLRKQVLKATGGPLKWRVLDKQTEFCFDSWNFLE